MDKELKQILLDIDFTPRYLDLWKKNEVLEGESNLLKEEILDIFDELGLSVKFKNKEKFFKHLENKAETDFQLNFIISSNRVTFVLYVFSKEHEIKTGGPFGLLAKRLDKKLKVFPKIAFNDYESLKESLQSGIKLFLEIKTNYLTLIGNK